MGSETTRKAMRISRSFRTHTVVGLLVGIVLTACYSVLLRKRPLDQQNITDGDPVYVRFPSVQPDPLDLSKFSNCTRRPSLEPKPKEEWAHAIWIGTPNYSLSESIHKDLINQLTGLANGGKSFYASTKQLRHCIGTTETATCSVSNAPPENDLFHSKYMLVLRNPKSLLPFAANSKGNLYHGYTGQTPIEQWRNIRDTWMEKMMSDWVSDIKDWMKTNYEIGLYIVYEDLFDIQKGPNIVKEIANVLKEGGFEVVDDDDFPCVWYNSIGEEKIQQYHKNKYDFDEYIPGFTEEQQELMTSSINEFIDEVRDNDIKLESILTRYVNNIRTETIIDKKWENKTSSE